MKTVKEIWKIVKYFKIDSIILERIKKKEIFEEIKNFIQKKDFLKENSSGKVKDFIEKNEITLFKIFRYYIYICSINYILGWVFFFSYYLTSNEYVLSAAFFLLKTYNIITIPIKKTKAIIKFILRPIKFMLREIVSALFGIGKGKNECWDEEEKEEKTKEYHHMDSAEREINCMKWRRGQSIGTAKYIKDLRDAGLFASISMNYGMGDEAKWFSEANKKYLKNLSKAKRNYPCPNEADWDRINNSWKYK